MPLRFGLIPNLLTDDPEDHMAVVTDNETVTTEQIVERMIGRGSTVTKAEALSVIEEFNAAVVDAVAEGNNVNTELFKVYPSIAGVFANAQDSFDPKRHAVRINLNAGNRLQQILSKIELRRVEVDVAQPTLQQFTDLKSNVVNESYTAGQIASIKGSLLKIDESDENQGIFFIAPDGTATQVTNIVKNMPSELLFFVPENLTGTVQVEVRTILRRQTQIKTGRLLIDLVAAG